MIPNYVQGVNGRILTTDGKVPTADCPYVSPDTCTGEPGSQPGGCCRGPPGSAAAKLGQLSMTAMLIIMSLLIFMF